MKKKLLIFTLAAVLALSVCGCGDNAGNGGNGGNGSLGQDSSIGQADSTSGFGQSSLEQNSIGQADSTSGFGQSSLEQNGTGQADNASGSGQGSLGQGNSEQADNTSASGQDNLGQGGTGQADTASDSEQGNLGQGSTGQTDNTSDSGQEATATGAAFPGGEETILTAEEAGLQVVVYSATKADFIIEHAYIPHRGGSAMVEFDWTDGKTYDVSLDNFGTPDNDFDGPFEAGLWEMMGSNSRGLVCEGEYSVDGEQVTISVDFTGQDIGGMSFGTITRYRMKNYVGGVMGSVEAADVTRLAEGVDEGNLDNSDAVYEWQSLHYVYNTDGGVTIVSSSQIFSKDGIPAEINGRPVTEIGKGAFGSHGVYQGRVDSVIIPDSVKKIGESAFAGCGHLVSVTFPAGLESIGEYAFGSTGLTSVTIPSGLVYMGERAFAGSQNLTSVTVESGAKHIGKSAFVNCEKLKTVNIASADEIGAMAFYRCEALTSVTLGSGVKKIGDEAFSCCKALKSIVIPGSVESIGEEAFEACYALESVVIESGVKSLGKKAFSDCRALESVKMGNGITILRNETFMYCISLVDIKLPDTLQKMEGRTFFNCDVLEEITIPGGMNSISDKLAHDEAFQQCYKLKKIHYGGHDYSYVTRKELYAAINSGTAQVPADNLFEYDDEIIGTYKQISVSDTSTDENAYLPNAAYDGILLTVVSNGKGGVTFVWWNAVSYYAMFENKDDILNEKSYYRQRFSDNPLALGSVKVTVEGSKITATFYDIMFNHAPEFEDVVRAPYTVTYTKESNDTYYWYQ